MCRKRRAVSPLPELAGLLAAQGGVLSSRVPSADRAARPASRWAPILGLQEHHSSWAPGVQAGPAPCVWGGVALAHRSPPGPVALCS